eukprot:scaffold4339_cov53-Cyclotella_meneghiniana.AAC.2
MKRLEASTWPVFLDVSFTGSQKTARKNKFTRQKNSVIATLVVVLVLQNLGISFCKTSSFGRKERGKGGRGYFLLPPRMNHKSKARSSKRRRWKETYHKKHKRKPPDKPPDDDSDHILIRSAKRKQSNTHNRVTAALRSLLQHRIIPHNLKPATILFGRRFNTLQIRHTISRRLHRSRLYRRRRHTHHTTPWLPKKQQACLCNTCVSLDRPKTHVKLCQTCDSNTIHLSPSFSPTTNNTTDTTTHDTFRTPNIHFDAINPHLSLLFLGILLIRQIICAISKTVANTALSAVAHLTNTVHHDTPNKTFHNQQQTNTTNDLNRHIQPEQHQRRQRHKLIITALLTTHSLFTPLTHKQQLRRRHNNNTNPSMSGKSILTSIFGNNNTNTTTLDYDDNTQSPQSSPSLLSPANSETLFNAKTQQISNSSNQREHNLPFEQPITTSTLTPNEVIAATPTDDIEQVPPTPPIMPTGVKIQINQPTSPESVTDRVITSSKATPEQPPQ